MKKTFLFTVVLLIVVLLAASVLIETEERTQLKMGTFVKITLCGPLWFDFDSAFKEAFAAVDRVDAMASAYNKDSEISRLNQTAGKGPVVVSDDLFLLISEAVKLSRNSQGAFDITVGPLIKLWKLYKEKKSLPSDSEIRRALSLVGYDKLILDHPKRSVSFARRGMSINLSAMAKGFAVDKAVAELKRAGFRSAIVNAGGDLYCLGKRNFLKRWRIGIADPDKKGEIARLLYLSNQAAASSGGYEQYYRYQGKDYPHIIDPKTGYSKESEFSSVTVVAANCMLADALATAVFVGGGPVKDSLKELYPSIKIIIED